LALAFEGSVQAQGWIYMSVWCAAAVGLIVCDKSAWHRPLDLKVVTSPEARHEPAAR
jgi:hypothetical protein